ncbi:MAG: NHL repeat-containing protein [Planctomycetota bacterium]
MRVQIAFASMAAAIAALARAGDCPQGADYLATLGGLRGACGVAWSGGELVACVPESIRAESAGIEAQLIAAARDADGVWGEPKAMTAAVAIGQRLRMAADIAVAANGDIAVADAAGVVFVRRASGDGAWAALGEGVLERPVGVSWVGGRIAVSDARLRAVVVLSADGREAARLGTGALLEPAGLAPLRDGSLVVADRLADCLWRFDAAADGSFAVAPVRLGESGSNPGQFSAPRDVCVIDRDGADCLLVADELNHRVQVVRSDGAFVGFFGMHALLPRQGEGRIHYPVSLAVASDGVTLAVAEAFEDRVQVLRLKPEADPVDPSAFGGEFISSHFGSEIGCGADTLAVVDREIEALAICDARTTPPIHMCVVGGGGALPMRFG